jgi:hypothetical protein
VISKDLNSSVNHAEPKILSNCEMELITTGIRVTLWASIHEVKMLFVTVLCMRNVLSVLAWLEVVPMYSKLQE